QLCGYGRSDWSTKLIRGLTSEAAAGFQSRRGLNHDESAPVTPHNAPFPTYKAAPVHHASGRRGGRVAIRGERAAAGDASDRLSADHLPTLAADLARQAALIVATGGTAAARRILRGRRPAFRTPAITT